MKEIKICYMSKSGRIPEGFYMFKEPNIWFPVLYFRKSKFATKKQYEAIKEYLKGAR